MERLKDKIRALKVIGDSKSRVSEKNYVLADLEGDGVFETRLTTQEWYSLEVCLKDWSFKKFRETMLSD